jgi:hypothetical protein
MALETGTHSPVGKPAVKGAGTRGARGARAKGAIDQQEQSKR